MYKFIFLFIISLHAFATDCAKPSDIVKYQDSIYVYDALKVHLNYNKIDILKECRNGQIFVVTGKLSSIKESSIIFLDRLYNLYIIELVLLFLVIASIINIKTFTNVVTFSSFLLITIISSLRFLSTGYFPIYSIYDTVWMSINILLVLSAYYLLKKDYKLNRVVNFLICVFLGLLIFFPQVFIKHVKTPMPVLRDNFWLMTHVTLMILSYTLLAITWICTSLNISLPKHFKIEKLTISKVLFSGIAFLAFGIFLGAIWADRAWGRFWAWDPKETWSLVTLCLYSIIFHLTKVKKLRAFEFDLLISLSFTGVLITWFGVNFVFASGLHSYGFSEGGMIIFFIFLGLQLLNIINFKRLRKL